MRRQHPDHRMDIPISLTVHHQLSRASINSGFEKEDWEIAAEAIDEWVRRHDPDALAAPAYIGYQWKRLFLPDGTVLRTVYEGKNYHCVVEGGRIAFKGSDVSPSGFVNAAGGVRRNAWLCAWILFPDSKQWQLADALRARRPRRPRIQKSAILTAAPPAVASAPTGIEPASSASPASAIHGAAGQTDATCRQSMVVDSVPQLTAERTASDGPPSAVFPLSPPRRVRATERRSNGDDRIATLLRQELGLEVPCNGKLG